MNFISQSGENQKNLPEPLPHNTIPTVPHTQTTINTAVNTTLDHNPIQNRKSSEIVINLDTKSLDQYMENFENYDAIFQRALVKALLKEQFYEILFKNFKRFHGTEDIQAEITRKALEYYIETKDVYDLMKNRKYLESSHIMEDLHSLTMNMIKEHIEHGKFYLHMFLTYIDQFSEDEQKQIVHFGIQQKQYRELFEYLNSFPLAVQKYIVESYMHEYPSDLIYKLDYSDELKESFGALAEILLEKEDFSALYYNIDKLPRKERLHTYILYNILRSSRGAQELYEYSRGLKYANPKLYLFFEPFIQEWQDTWSDNDTVIDRMDEMEHTLGDFYEVFDYLIRYKPKEFVPFFQSIRDITGYHELDLRKVISLTKIDWIQKEDTFEVKSKLLGQYQKLLSIVGEKNIERKIKSFEHFLSIKKQFDDEKTEKIKQYFGEVLIPYSKRFINHRIKNRIRREFRGHSKEEIHSLIKNELFMEIFKMYQRSDLHREQFKSILNAFSKKQDIDDVRSLLDNEDNNSWREYIEKQGVNMKAFLSEHRETMEVGSHAELHTVEKDINHHIRVAGDKLEDLGFERFETARKLIEWYQKYVKKPDIQEELFRKLHKEKALSREIFDTLLADIALQVESIQKLNTNRKAKEITSLTMYRETDPMRVLMMGNWVDGSCLSFYSSVGNFWSTAINALDINKAVYYIEDQNGNIVGRVLVAIDDVGKLVRFRTYKKGNISVDLDTYFDPYIRKIAKESGLGLNGRQWDVDPLNGEKWYMDGEKEMGE